MKKIKLRIILMMISMVTIQALADGNIRVSFVVKDANITIDGKHVGVSSGQYNDFRVSDGNHTIGILKEEELKIYKEIKTIFIEDGDATEVKFTTLPKLTKKGKGVMDERYGHLEERNITGDIVIIDKKNGLTWITPSGKYDKRGSWDEAHLYCKDLKFASFDDWRLPNIYEGITFLDDNPEKDEFTNFTYKIMKLSGSVCWLNDSSFTNALGLSITGDIRTQPKKNNNTIIRCVRGKKLTREPLLHLDFLPPKDTNRNDCTKIEGGWRNIGFKEAIHLLDFEDKSYQYYLPYLKSPYQTSPTRPRKFASMRVNPFGRGATSKTMCVKAK